MKKSVRTTALLLTVLALLFSCLSPAFAEDSLEQACDAAAAGAGAAIVYDVTNNKVLYTKNGSKEIRVASITKVLNACVAVQYFDEDDPITVGDEVYLCIPAASRAGV